MWTQSTLSAKIEGIFGDEINIKFGICTNYFKQNNVKFSMYSKYQRIPKAPCKYNVSYAGGEGGGLGKSDVARNIWKQFRKKKKSIQLYGRDKIGFEI